MMSSLKDHLYYYNFELVRVIDGDTVVANIDLGFKLWKKASIRFSRINAPERGTPEAAAATEFVINKFATCKERVLKSTKVDKYGRVLGELYLDGVCLNDELLENGLAVEYGK